MIEHLDFDPESVMAAYGGSERALWELIMGEQIHIGGMQSSLALAEAAGIASGSRGVDLCCCTGAGMRFLVRFCGVGHMTGVDKAPAVIEAGRTRSSAAGMSERMDFLLADACQTGLETAGADFVWGEDAWCYVKDKQQLIAEASRLARPGGVVAFTDWTLGPQVMSGPEAQRLLRFMKFPNLVTINEYVTFMESQGLRVLRSEDTERFAPCVDLYLDAVERQLTYDVLRILDFDSNIAAAVKEEMVHMRELAHAGQIVQALFVARREP
ncbi:MAG: methyltransferase domain-containing protein [Candidatus Hydrogenedentes bacterium]|nr:methyltransferase domain-containing protein [Candidatus Hydrogenedentota bacterium]